MCSIQYKIFNEKVLRPRISRQTCSQEKASFHSLIGVGWDVCTTPCLEHATAVIVNLATVMC